MVKKILDVIMYLVWGVWRLLLLTVATIIFLAVWFWPPFFYLFEDSLFASLWVYTFGFCVFYGLALWHVVSENEGEVSVWIKMRQGLFSAFNKMLFGFVTLGLYGLFVGFILSLFE